MIFLIGLLVTATHGRQFTAYERLFLSADTPMQLPIKHLAGIKPSKVFVANGEWDRGYRPIVWEYVVQLPLTKAARAFSEELPILPFQPGVPVDPDKLTWDANLQRTGSGVRQHLRMSKGVLNAKHNGYEEVGTEVTLQVTESVTEDGPLPAHWPDKCVPCPLTDYPLPWGGLSGKLTSIYWGETPSAWHMQYGFTFLVPQPYSDVFNGVKATIGPIGYKTSPTLPDADFRSQTQGTYISVDIKPGTPDNPAKSGWTTVSYGTVRLEKKGETPGPWGR